MRHVYFREIDPGANDSLATVAGQILSQSRVLDVGTGSGALGRHLKMRNCAVDGITYSEEEARQAQVGYDRIEIINLEDTLPSAIFPANSYDVVVCADILEHLRNAVDVLADLHGLLAPKGRILLSIPNATYMGVLFGLLASRFVRTQEGILDATHVNFFDRQGLEQLVERAGYRISAVLDVRKGLIDSEFAALDTLALPSHIRQYVLSLPDADVYQFVWELIPKGEHAVASELLPPARPFIPVALQFDAQLFWDVGDGFDESLSVHARGEMSEKPQALKFDVRVCEPMLPPVRIRLDLVDRPGIFEFFHFRLLNSDGQEIAVWKGDWTPELQLNDCEILPETGLHGGRLMRATGGDPWISLPAASGWQDAAQAELLITAPQPYRDAAFHWAERRYSERIESLEFKTGELETKNQDLETKNQVLDIKLQHSLLDLEERNRQHRDVCHALTLERDALAHRIADLEASTSWRITAGLRWFSRLIKKV